MEKNISGEKRTKNEKKNIPFPRYYSRWGNGALSLRRMYLLTPHSHVPILVALSP
jgi:hypothetical protein